MIPGGYYIIPRQTKESEIAHSPPHVREIWNYLLKEANHKDVGNVKRGSTVRSLRDMQEALSWFVGYRKEMYSKSKCEMATNALRKRGMITTMKTTRGMIITICNYDYYQNPKNYETNNEKSTKPTRNQQSHDTINKNVEETINEVINIPFESFWNLYDKKVGRKKAEKAWNSLSSEDRKDIMQVIPNYKKSKPDKQFRRNPETFLNKTTWEDEIIISELKKGVNTISLVDISKTLFRANDGERI